MEIHNISSQLMEKTAQFGLIEWDVLTDTVILCPYLVNILDFPDYNLVQPHKVYGSLTHPDDLPAIVQLSENIKNHETQYICTENRKLCRDKSWRWFSLRSKIMETDTNGNPLRAFGTLTDITYLKEEELKHQKVNFLFDQINHIKKLNKINYGDTSIHFICEEIIKTLNKIIDYSNAILLFSSLHNTSQKNYMNLYHFDGRRIDELNLSSVTLTFIKNILTLKTHTVYNDGGVSLFGIYLHLPFNQQGVLLIERVEPFNNVCTDFIEPFADAINHILSIKKLEEYNNELDTMLSFFIKQVPAPVAMFDTKMNYMFASNAWIKNFKLGSIENIMGKCHYDLFPDRPDYWKENIYGALQGELKEYGPEFVTHINDDPMWVEGALHPWYAQDGSIGGIFFYANIVTERIVVEQNLINTVDNLKQSNQSLEQFAHICSHDLKEPLRSISSFIQLLLRNHKNEFTDESRLYMNHVINGVARMDTLIKDILAYSKIVGQAGVKRERLDMNKLLGEIKTVMNYRFSELDGRIEIDSLPVMLGNETQINQLFTNLIDNAIKFRSDRPLVIHISAVDSGHFWEFHVRDNGIGIAEEYQTTVFSMFKRLHGKSQYEGSGIGLGICQKIVHEHHGNIHMQSVPAGGSDFVITFPKEL